MNDLVKLNAAAARELFMKFAPMFERLENKGVKYCLVGGLGVVAHCLVQDSERLRATRDADLIVPINYTNSEFASDYLIVYASNPESAQTIYDVVVGKEGFEELKHNDLAQANISFIGADVDLDGVETPSFDVCRVLNGRSVDSIKKEQLNVCGIKVWVATIEELLNMKKDTIALYGDDPLTYPREQDYLDVKTLEYLRTKTKNEGIHE